MTNIKSTREMRLKVLTMPLYGKLTKSSDRFDLSSSSRYLYDPTYEVEPGILISIEVASDEWQDISESRVWD